MSMPGSGNFPPSGHYPGSGFSGSAFFDSRVESLKKQFGYSFGVLPHMKRFKGLGGSSGGTYPIAKVQEIPTILKLAEPFATVMGSQFATTTTQIYWKAWKVSWYEFKREYTKHVKDDSNDRSYWIPKWVDEVGKLIPVRSGHLYSTMLGSIYIQRVSVYASRHWIFCTYEYAYNPQSGQPYPTQFRNVRHTPPDQGYGNKPALVDTRQKAPNVSLIRITPSGYGVYLLNDPGALNDPRYELNSAMSSDMYWDMKTKFDSMVIMVTI